MVFFGQISYELNVFQFILFGFISVLEHFFFDVVVVVCSSGQLCEIYCKWARRSRKNQQQQELHRNNHFFFGVVGISIKKRTNRTIIKFLFLGVRWRPVCKANKEWMKMEKVYESKWRIITREFYLDRFMEITFFIYFFICVVYFYWIKIFAWGKGKNILIICFTLNAILNLADFSKISSWLFFRISDELFLHWNIRTFTLKTLT